MSKINSTDLIFLKALWENDRLSAKELHVICAEQLDWSFSSTRTTLTRMAAKGLITPAKHHGVTTYAASSPKVKTLAGMMQDFMSRVLEIKGPLPTSAFQGSEVLNSEELTELQAILDDTPDPSDEEGAA